MSVGQNCTASPLVVCFGMGMGLGDRLTTASSWTLAAILRHTRNPRILDAHVRLTILVITLRSPQGHDFGGARVNDG